MLRASLYIIACTTRNRVRVRLRRLREPRYLIGAIVGVAYLYFSVFAGGGTGRRSRAGRSGNARRPVELLSAWQVVGTSLAGLGVFAMAAVVWILPTRSGLLEFSRAETAFLFPAPVSRRQLLLYRVMRSQLGSLIAAVVMAVVLAPAYGLGRLQVAASMWVLFVTARVYFAAVALTRARLSSPDAAVRRGAWPPIAILLAALAVVVGAVVRQFITQRAADASDFAVRLARTASTGLPAMVLWPFAALVRPQLALGPAAFVVALGGSLLVLAVTTAWMLTSDEGFERAAEETAGPFASETRLRRSGPRARRVGWTLSLIGRPEGLFVWKNAMQTFRASDAGLLRFVVPVLGALVGLSLAVMAANRLRGPAGFVSGVSLVIAGFAVLFGPQVMRLDLRGDLEYLEVLKTWPVQSSAVIRGQILWPACVVTAAAWIGIVCAAMFAGTAFPRLPSDWRWALAASATLAAPALVAAQYVVHNAVAVFFPAWVPIGRQRVRGVDAMGQRLIMLAGIIASLLVFALPGALVGAIVWFAFERMLGPAVLVPATALFTVIVLMEVLVATELLGPAYERLDLLSVERGD
jgi:ABC-2 type transport system permease protein